MSEEIYGQESVGLHIALVKIKDLESRLSLAMEALQKILDRTPNGLGKKRIKRASGGKNG